MEGTINILGGTVNNLKSFAFETMDADSHKLTMNDSSVTTNYNRVVTVICKNILA